ncbi:MAG: hypothetical protein S4CHLAM123_07710 [Chlamydiales bacterium]|nr:hypothetical protein [Chlamydiales bacterium]
MLIPELKKFASLPIEDNAGFTLLTLPKGLSFNKLVEIAGSPKQENASLFAFIGVNFEDQLGDQATDTSCTVLISNSILENSRSKTLANHQEIVGQYKCEMPGVLDAATVVVLTQRIDGKPLFTERIYTRCSDKINGRGMVVVGFGSFGLDVTYDYGRDSDGVAALRKF